MTAQDNWASAAHAKSPAGTGPVADQNDAATQDTTSIAGALRQRREASRRLPVLPCGHRDSIDCRAAEVPAIIGPERFGLTTVEAHRHANELLAVWGWAVNEVVEVLGIEPRAGMAA